MTTKKDNIVSYTREHIEARRSAGITGTDWARIDSMSREEINRLAIEDLDKHGIAHDWYKNAYPVVPPVVVVNIPRSGNVRIMLASPVIIDDVIGRPGGYCLNFDASGCDTEASEPEMVEL